MEANRFYLFRQKRGFGEREFESLKASWLDWKKWVEKRIDDHREDWGDRIQYIFFEPELSNDRTVARVALGGQELYPAVGMFEGEVLYRSIVAGIDPEFVSKMAVRCDRGPRSTYSEAHWIPAYSYLESPGIYQRLKSILRGLLVAAAGPPALRWLWTAFVLMFVGAYSAEIVGGLRAGQLPEFFAAANWYKPLGLLAFGLFSLGAAILGWRGYLFEKSRRA
jgi:hypothetical protein